MKGIRWLALLCASVVLVGCPENKNPESRAAARTASMSTVPTADSSGVTLTLDTMPISAETTRGDGYSVELSGNWSVGTGTAGSVFLQASDSAGTFIVPPVMPAPKRASYDIQLTLAGSATAGNYNGTLTVRACQDSLCAQPYADTTRSITYSLKVNAVGEWETLQRNTAHDGYVPIRLNPSNFVKVWEWRRPTSGVLNAVNAVATYDGKVFVSEDEYAGSPSVYALRASDGVAVWRRQFNMSPSPSLSPPTVTDGVVYVTTSGHSSSYLWALRASDGLPVFQSPFSTQWANLLAPTVKNGRAFVNAGYYSGVVYAYGTSDGASAWSANGGMYGMNTPAVDDSFVYIHNGTTLNVLDMVTGQSVMNIGPNNGGSGGEYHGFPMLGSQDHVIAFNGGAFSGRASSSQEATTSRQLMNYSIANGALRWATIAAYRTIPAVAKGVVYAASNESKTLDAIDEATGSLLWSWRPPEPDVSFHRNVVVTNDVVFVSTARAVYAVSLASKRPVWQSPTPGALAISADRMLFIATGRVESDGRVVAFRLR